MSKHKLTKATEFSKAERDFIIIRDNRQCIFCEMEYHMELTSEYGRKILSIMHYIPRSQKGLGIRQNGALGCQNHHELLDNGNKGLRGEMLELFKQYLQRKNPGWKEQDLIYDKWRNL